MVGLQFEQVELGNKGYYFFEKDKDKDNILVDNILAIILEDIFRQLILQKIRILWSYTRIRIRIMNFWRFEEFMKFFDCL